MSTNRIDRLPTANGEKTVVEELPLDCLKPFRDHPFKVAQDEEMERLKESIRESGVLVPALARPTENGYELIAGHRRLEACRALGKETLPVIIRDLTDEEAVITMVDTNLQREHILPSEKAFAYKMKYDAMKRLPGRKENGDQLGHQIKSIDRLAADSPDSRNQIQRYIRLTNLIPEILQMVDDEKIALTPAVELSYLDRDEQAALFSVMECDEVTPSLSQAQRLRHISAERGLFDDDILAVMSELKGNQKEYVKMEAAPIMRYFPPGTTPKEMQETMLRAMEFYRQHTRQQLHKSRDREER